MTYDWLRLQSAYAGLNPPRRRTLFTVNGTGVPDPFGPGFAGDTGRAVDDEKWLWQPVGYPAAVTPMGPSVQAGARELLRLIDLHPGQFAVSGYSQGAMVVNTVWRDHLLGGDHQHRLADCVGIINYGDPMRCPGIANGNTVAGVPVPGTLDGATTGGIAGKGDLTAAQTPPFLLSCALPGDLYATAPVGDDPWTAVAAVGADEQLIFDLIQSVSFSSTLELASAVVKLLNRPLVEVIALVEALVNGLTFAVKGVSAPHWQYQGFVPAMANWLNQR